jgi:tetratricopeptide (TPR) repeat protein
LLAFDAQKDLESQLAPFHDRPVYRNLKKGNHMGILKIFSGKDPEEYKQKGDAYFEEQQYGLAKIEYESGLSKLERRSPGDIDLRARLEQKIVQTQEALALQHSEAGEELINAALYEEAEEILRLAMELTEEAGLKAQIEQRLKDIREHAGNKEVDDIPRAELQEPSVQEPGHQVKGDDYFGILCGSLPEEIQKAYYSYGDAFRAGYMALNQGDFELAAAKLSQAFDENPGPHSFIPLELATAYLNLSQHDAARSLLEGFIKEHPDSVQAYYLLCEILWEMGEFDEIHKLLDACPAELGETLPIQLLRGETLFKAGRYEDAESLYLDYLRSYDWDENIARSLARTYEALGENESACELYGEILGECRSCGARVDPFIRQRYADLCFDSGDYSTRVLELYLSLVHEDPGNKPHYYRKISRIYSSLGHEEEAERYRAFADNSENLKPGAGLDP